MSRTVPISQWFSQRGLPVPNTAINRAIAFAGDKSGTEQSGPGSASAKDETKVTDWFRTHSDAEAKTTIASAVTPRQRDFFERCYAAARAKDAIAEENP